MTKHVDFNWKIPPSKELLEGAVLDRWTEEKDAMDSESDCLFKVDDCGFYIYWKSEGREGDVLDVSQVNDIRPGEHPKDERLKASFVRKHGENYLEKAFIICSGLDMVNIRATNVICKDVSTLNTWKKGLRSLTNNVKMNNICPMIGLQKHHLKILLSTEVDGKVGVKTIAKTFASGKSEKQVYQILADNGLPNGKGDSMEKDKFTFDIFYQIYDNICIRTDIEDLFKSLTKTETLAGPKFMEFLNDKQRDSRLNQILYPEYNKNRVKEIITHFEPNQENVAAEVISKEGLIKYLMSDDNAPVFLDR